MAQLCTSSSSPTDDAHGIEMVQGKLKRIPRCMQIDLLPLVATSMIMTRAHRPSNSTEISPAIWDKQLQVWTRNGSMLPFVKPPISKVVDEVLEEHLQRISNHAEEPTLTPVEDTNNENVPIKNLTRSTSLESFSPVNLANAPGRAWLSSTENASTFQGRNVLFCFVAGLEIENPPEEISQVLEGVENMSSNPNIWDAAKQNPPEEISQVLDGVENMSSNPNIWDAANQQGNGAQISSNDRSCSLNECQHGTSLKMKGDDSEECSTILDDFLEPQVDKPLKLCSAFISPWLDQKPSPFPDSPETLSGSPSGSIDWTGDETTDAEGFDGVGLRPQSDRNAGNSRRRHGGTVGGSRRNTRQRIEDPPNRNLIANDLDDFDRFETGANLPMWFPRPGDIIIHSEPRPRDDLSPGGHVTLYKDEQFFSYTGNARLWRQFRQVLQDGDFAVRIGKFTEDWKFHQTPRIETFLLDDRTPPYFWLVARTFNHQLQPPEYQFDRQFRAPLNTVDRNFCPRLGDLVVRVVRGERTWGLYWWNHNFNFNPGDLVLRAGYEVKPNGTRMVVELYLRELDDRDWSFRGRDFWTYLNANYLIPDPQEPQPMDLDR